MSGKYVINLEESRVSSQGCGWRERACGETPLRPTGLTLGCSTRSWWMLLEKEPYGLVSSVCENDWMNTLPLACCRKPRLFKAKLLMKWSYIYIRIFYLLSISLPPGTTMRTAPVTLRSKQKDSWEIMTVNEVITKTVPSYYTLTWKYSVCQATNDVEPDHLLISQAGPHLEVSHSELGQDGTTPEKSLGCWVVDRYNP